MKYLLTLALIVLSLIGKAQNYTMVINTPSSAGDVIHWSVTNNATSSVAYEYTHTNAGQLTVHMMTLSAGTYTFEITTTNCNSFSGGCYALTSSDDVIAYGNSSFGCISTQQFTVVDHPCINDCPTDLNNDGITSVSDLLIFIGEYGTICN